MMERLERIEAKVYSPSVMVAIIGLVGTFATVFGSVIVVGLQIFAKWQGWVGP